MRARAAGAQHIGHLENVIILLSLQAAVKSEKNAKQSINIKSGHPGGAAKQGAGVSRWEAGGSELELRIGAN